MPEEKKKKFGKHLYPFIGILGIVITIVFLCFTANSGVKRKKEDAYHMLELYGVRTESLLNELFHKTDIIESVVITNRGHMDKETFDNLAKTLTEGKGVKALQGLPDGIVTFCYPQEGNESVMGNNIFEMPERREDALLALKTKEIALSGPYNLTQGGFGLVARNPIFLEDGNGAEKFWGFSVVVLNLPEALEPLMLSELVSSGYQYQLSCEVNGERVIVDQSSKKDSEGDEKLEDKEYLAVDIKVPNHVWQLKVVPKDGWINKKMMAVVGLIGISFTFLFTVIIALLERQSRQMEEYATTDELTGLFNRRRLKEYMDIRCRDKKVMFAMFYIDLNHFKAINDTLGHACGDEVLKVTGRRIKTALGKEGSVYRVGGDEFIAVMELDVSEENCRKKETQMKGEIGKPFVYEKHSLNISASIGYVMFPEQGEDMDGLIKVADAQMYLEKKR